MKEELEAVKKTDNHEAAFEIRQQILQVHLLLGIEKKAMERLIPRGLSEK